MGMQNNTIRHYRDPGKMAHPGQVRHSLKIIRPLETKTSNGEYQVLCLCLACGNEKAISRPLWLRNEAKTCGCRKGFQSPKNKVMPFKPKPRSTPYKVESIVEQEGYLEYTIVGPYAPVIGRWYKGRESLESHLAKTVDKANARMY